jgi:hypothetical protein
MNTLRNLEEHWARERAAKERALRMLREEARSKAKWVPHIDLDGARFHVLMWDTFGPKCSEPRCEINKERAKRKRSRCTVYVRPPRWQT